MPRPRSLLATLVGLLALSACTDTPTAPDADVPSVAAAPSLLTVAPALLGALPGVGTWALPTAFAHGGADPAVYDFDDLAEDCNFDVPFPNPYHGLVFTEDPVFLASCHDVVEDGDRVVVPNDSDGGRFDPFFVSEIRVVLPHGADQAAVSVYMLPDAPDVTFRAYDADFVELDAAVATTATEFEWTVLTVAAPGIAALGFEGGQGIHLLDDLTVHYVTGPQEKDDCKDGGWASYGFRNQGQCVRFIETGKDSRD